MAKAYNCAPEGKQDVRPRRSWEDSNLRTAGIYSITHESTGRRYIGSSINVHKRWRSHWQALLYGGHKNQHLQRAFRRYGSKAFAFRVLCWCEPTLLTLFEQRFFDIAKPEFNLCPLSTSVLGIERSQQTRERLSEARKRSNWMRGRAGKNHPMYGRMHTAEARAKMRKAQHRIAETRRGVPRSAEVRAKISVGLTGKQLSDQHKARLSAAKRGKPLSEKNRAGLRKAWARRLLKELLA